MGKEKWVFSRSTENRFRDLFTKYNNESYNLNNENAPEEESLLHFEMFTGKKTYSLKPSFKLPSSEKMFDDIIVSYAYHNNSKLHFHFTKIFKLFE